MSASESAFFFAVVSEAESDQQIAGRLAERVLVEQIDWLDFDNLAELCRWGGFDEGDAYLTWSGIEGVAKRPKLVVHGRYAGAFDERRARLALLLFNGLERRPDAVLFVRDTDNVAERVPSLERAREYPWPFAVVLATPHTKRECWVLNGFEPTNAEEEAALARARRKIGFDPCLSAERLTAKREPRRKNAKVVLKEDLEVEPGSAREEACWRKTDLDVLRERGVETRLTAYLQEVVDRLVPVLVEPSG